MGRPHILVIMPDQLRADCMSCAGNRRIATPGMDRIASEGIRLARAYTTSPVCMPARSTFLSGLYCHNHGQWGNRGCLPPDSFTYLRPLKEAGYRTCHIGKSHLYEHGEGAHLDEHLPYMRTLGWDDVLETTGPWATWRTDSIMTDRWRKAGCLDTYREDYAKRRKAGSLDALWPSPMPEEEHLDAFIGRTAVEYLEKMDPRTPHLVFVGFGGPHEPWDPPASWAAKYDPASMEPPKPPTEAPAWLPEAAAKHHRKLQDASECIPAETARRIRALYFAKIAHIDWWIGRILDTVERRGLLDDTAIVFWSDHGEMLCDKGRLHKSVFYEEAARIPFIVRPPGGRKAGLVSDALVSLADAAPTILQMGGCEPPGWLFGRSLLRLLDDSRLPHHDAVFSEIDRRTMIRDDGHKMVVDDAGNVLKLYDMREDPQENLNLAGRSGTDPVVGRLRERLLEWHLATPSRQRS